MMRQKAGGGLPLLRQKTPNTPGETLSEMNIAPMAFSLNQSNAVCLPLVSDSQGLIWVHSNEINLQLDGAAELEKAFDRFPYLTEKQTAALAQRCFLHPDQVKVWFMVQRLRYGISWDFKDIPKVRTIFKARRGKEKLQNEKGEEVKEDRGEKSKREVEDAGGKEAGGVREKQKASEGENVRTNERLARKMKQEQPMKKEKDKEVEEDTGNTLKKRKRMTVTDKMGKKRIRQGEEGVVETAEEVETRSDDAERGCEKSTQSETTLFTRKKMKAKADKGLLSVQEWPVHESFVVPDELLDAQLIPLLQTQAFDVPPLTDNQTELLKRVDASTSHTRMTPVKSSFKGETEMQTHAESTTDVGKLKELVDMNLVADSSLTAHAHTLPPRVRWTTKTQTQLDMMRAAFSHSQYPDGEDYNRLARVINVARYELVQWFGDMRYYIKKKGKPGWMSQEQHSRALANVRYRQWLNTLVKMQPLVAGSKGDGKAT
ncbi:homeobox and leucine zipper encoding b [Sebastes fasciatus]|uniref:homeobox and leucine zipper encoding b n=1 Tax=Sebastes fasciatus TaxID=394691 RepID=UPI003D9F62A5